MAFMMEKEKKEELMMKQRAELAIKKGTAELPSAVEKALERRILQQLEDEVASLLNEDGIASSTSNTSSSLTAASIVDRFVSLPPPETALKRKQQQSLQHQRSLQRLQLTSSSPSHRRRNRTSSGDSLSRMTRKRTSSSSSAIGGTAAMNGDSADATLVSLDDLFDLEYIEPKNILGSATNGERQGDGDDESVSTSSSSNSESRSSSPSSENDGQLSNEFAAELLYILQTSRTLS